MNGGNDAKILAEVKESELEAETIVLTRAAASVWPLLGRFKTVVGTATTCSLHRIQTGNPGVETLPTL